jgi:hypothetical protein
MFSLGMVVLVVMLHLPFDLCAIRCATDWLDAFVSK